MARHKEFETTVIIDRAIDVFMAKGYEATSVKDLVDATGFHPGSLYNAFGSKKQIFEAALDRFYEVSPFTRTLVEGETAPPRDTLRRLLLGVAEPDRHAGSYEKCLVTNAAAEFGSSDAELAGRLQGYFQQMEDRLCRLVQRGQRVGEFNSDRSARDHARFLLSVIQGMSLLARLSADRRRLRVIADMAMASLEPTTDKRGTSNIKPRKVRSRKA
jgi:TetR/AcrR family transcriptional repressor of nem operon